MKFVLPFEKIRNTDVDIVGGKNASLGEMITQLHSSGVKVPTGFATTSYAFKDFLEFNNLNEQINEILKNLDVEDIKELANAGRKIRSLIEKAQFRPEFEKEIRKYYEKLDPNNNGSFAVRSSATAEDLPDASFAGQQETFLNISGIDNILNKIKLVFASLYNDRAISYRVHKGFCHFDVALSAGVQKMVRSDKGSSGVMFSIDTESGFDKVVFITSSYGLGECVVQGAVNPDEFYVSKESLLKGKKAIISKKIGSKLIKMEFNDIKSDTDDSVKIIEVDEKEQNKFSLNDKQIMQLAKYAIVIENHYKRPMDIEWGFDGIDKDLYILQARPETVKSQKKKELSYKLKSESKILITGRAIGQKISVGKVKVVKSVDEICKVQEGDVLVTDMTDPNWEPVMKKAAAIITNRGGRTCHAAIIARELGIGAVVGTGNATEILNEGEIVSVSCVHGDEGRIYEGKLEYETCEEEECILEDIGVKIMMNVGNPALAFKFAQMPNHGVGLARLEFIINNHIGIHPNAILDYPNIEEKIKVQITNAIKGYKNARDFFVNKLAEGISTIAASFYPKPVIIRLSDFKTNEYRKLIGGEFYEALEENPMLGFRGASRYLAPNFINCFKMECEALKIARDEMGLDNIQIMVPFVRTLSQANSVINLLENNGLKRGVDGLKIIMMCEVPSNAILCDEFLEYFDGFSIGSNDLTQLTLGLDRDSGMDILVADFDERDEAVLFMLKRAISACKKANKYIGICGQGPSDHLDLAIWLQKEGITSMSLNPDSVISTWKRLRNL